MSILKIYEYNYKNKFLNINVVKTPNYDIYLMKNSKK